MAVTYSKYDASTPIGGKVAKGVDLFLQGYALIKQAHEAANAATDAGTTKNNLIAGDFGAVDSADAILMWNALNTVVTLVDGDAAGGLFTLGLGSLDKGLSA